jgi:hypothetical protein
LTPRQALAWSQEAAGKLNTSFQNALSRPIDASNLSAAHEGLDNGFFTQASWLSYLASVSEAAADLNASFQHVLNRPIDAGNLAAAQAGLTNGFFTQASWLSYLSKIPETQTNLNTAYLNILHLELLPIVGPVSWPIPGVYRSE